jgi:hypothetical protein
MLDKITYLECGEKRYPMAFTLNVMESLQENYGSLDEWSKLIQNAKEPNVKALKFFITEAINEGLEIEGNAEKRVTSKEVGRILTEVGLANSAQKIKNLISSSVPKSEENEKNAKTTRNKTKK